ncbi:MAG TPA: amidase [Caulobacteraceae bacterium]|jgi:aspartyl-tRNA(Asn)/glutamyl-tRNA(Gln) amidotransferase subunit A|nr:amidase [Caulobacteraceae bacterium]
MNLVGRTLADLATDLARSATTSRELTEAALAAIESDPRPFTRVWAESARVAADASDRLRAQGIAPSPFAGIPISVKDLFDVAGEPTPAGATILASAPVAPADAPTLARLRAAGFVLVGRTQMSEFAFTGVGLNPHRPQPVNPRDPARAPGGSSGGAAVSVALGQAAGAIGTDTGGSVRIPAAFCGLVGFKPTQRRITREGAFPLSHSLDSIGPIANSAACCRVLDAILADQPSPLAPSRPIEGLRLGVPRQYLLEGLEPAVAAAFDAALSALSAAGARIESADFPELDTIPAISARAGGTISNAEAFAVHRRLGLLEQREHYDPNVLARVEVGGRMGAADYLDLIEARARLIEASTPRMAPYDALVAPTVPILAPGLDALADPAQFARLNGLALRNTSVVNQIDGCAISLPVGASGLPVGLMLMAPPLADAQLLAIAEVAEPVLRRVS